MFTGIIEEIGRIRRIERGGVSGALTIEAKTILEDMRIGDSIAVNGICLTVRESAADTFTVDVMHETFLQSCAASYRPGVRVNLERAMMAGGRFGGHIVTGHIDGTGRVRRSFQDGNAVWYEIYAPPHILRCLVPKGSIAVNGVSLTVAALGTDSFSVSLIPHTRNMTTMSELREGSTVNLENDCIGKYVERLLSGQSGGRGGVTKSFLAENGFL